MIMRPLAKVAEQIPCEKVERARGGHLRIELTNTPRRDIARIGEGRLTRLHARLVHLLKRGDRHVNLTAHDELSRWLLDRGTDPRHIKFRMSLQKIRDLLFVRNTQRERNRLDRFDVLCYVFSNVSVSARRSDHQSAFDVLKRNGKSVKLHHRVEIKLALSRTLKSALVPFFKLFYAEDIFHREHPRLMLDFAEFWQRFPTNALCRRVGRDEIGILLF